MVKALIFDFDGVIVLSEQARFSTLQKIAQRYGVSIPDSDFKNIVGRTTVNFFKLFVENVSEETLQMITSDFKREFKDKIVNFVTPVPATIDFIKSYSGDKALAVASGSTNAVLEAVLKHFGIFDKFAYIIGQEHVTKHKPDPEVYTLTATHLGVSPSDCIVIEDTAVGAQAALNAGMSAYVFLNGTNSKIEFDDVAVTGFLETTDQISQLLS